MQYVAKIEEVMIDESMISRSYPSMEAFLKALVELNEHNSRGYKKVVESIESADDGVIVVCVKNVKSKPLKE